MQRRAGSGGGRRSLLAITIRRTTLLLGVVVLLCGIGWSAASMASLSPELPLAASSFIAPSAEPARCLSVRERHLQERENCFHRIRWELIEGLVDLDEAVRRLELCDAAGARIRHELDRSAALRLERYDAQEAFGRPLPRREAAERQALAERLGAGSAVPSAAAVARLERAGITHGGFIDPDGRQTLSRLRGSAALRRDFREVFGPHTADDLERMLGIGDGPPLVAVRIGSSVVVPRDAPGEPLPPPRVLALPHYTEEVAGRFEALEEARLGYLASAGELYRLTGSVGTFLRSLRSGDPAAITQSAARRAEVERTGMLARLEDLQHLGLDPALLAVAREVTAATGDLSSACGAAALRRSDRVRTGAGMVTGLVGAATIVLALGATGTLAGGVLIAATVHALGGAYLVYRSETPRLLAAEQQARAAAELPLDDEEEFRRPESRESLAEGAEGTGGAHHEEPPGEGEWKELEEGSREGDEFEEEGEATEPEPRRTSVPPLLPPPLDEDAYELPPMLSPDALGDLRLVPLSEAQERIDEFLALDGPGPAPAPQLSAVGDALTSELIEEARAALQLWVERRELSAGFGTFFLRAELQNLPASRRTEMLQQATGRYARDRAVYRGSGSIDELRRKIGQRLVVHCRRGTARGDLMLQACSDPTALTLVIVAAIRDAELSPPTGSVLGVQAHPSGFEPVLYRDEPGEVVSLSSGDRTLGVAAPLYHPAAFYYSFLLEHGVKPGIDPEEHLLIAHADPALVAAVEECTDSRGRLTRAMDWLRSLIGLGMPSRRGNGCAEANGDSRPRRDAGGGAGARSGIDISLPRPSLPRPSGGGQGGGGGARGAQGGEGSGSEGGSGGSEGAGGRSGGSDSAGGGASEGGGGAGGSKDGSDRGDAAAQPDARDSGARAAVERATADPGDPAAAGGGSGTEGGGGGASGGDGGAGSPDSASAAGGATGGGQGSGADGGEGSGLGIDQALDLRRVARESAAMSNTRGDGALRLRPWRLSETLTFIPSSGGVYYADNERASSRFGPHDSFITMSPSLTETQRRMFEADAAPVFPAGTECSERGLPRRRVFRGATGIGSDYRYVYCDLDESMVVFRTRDEAVRYARLSPADRPLFLTRLASERIRRFEQSAHAATIHAFLADPDILRSIPVEELDSLVNTAGQLLWLHETLEAMLFLSMHELQGSSIRGYYYDLNRQVARSPALLELVTAAHRFNQRLASDPLRTLAWANALPPEHRKRFFALYYTLGAPMHWPRRWEALHRRYGSGSPPTSAVQDAGRPSVDFLQVMSDPTRVHVDWPAERPADRPSIRDTRMQHGAEKTHEERARPTTAEVPERQETAERRRGGTRGLGRVGEGEGLGPVRGRRPLQMINIRVEPETGDPDRPSIPEHNPTRPGGTEGTRKVQEESSTQQEPALWLEPETFLDAILSAWDPPREGPDRARRVPPAVRFSPRLREQFLDRSDDGNAYEGRLTFAMSILSSGGWLRYAEVRDAMGGEWNGVRAFDTGRSAAEVSRNAPTVDQDQVRGINYFTDRSIAVPADLFDALRNSFSRYGDGSFDLRRLDANEAVNLPRAEAGSAEEAAARAELLRSLQLIAEQNRSRR